MATYNISLDHVCAGGSHATINIAKEGVPFKQWVFSREELTTSPDPGAYKEILLTLLQYKFDGMTPAQINGLLTTGFDLVF